MLSVVPGYLQLMYNIKRSPKEIKKIQWRMFKKILAHAYNDVPFYRERFQKAGITPDNIQSRKDIKKIPITTKEELRNAGNKIFAKGYSKDNCNSSKTTGSTGLPFTSYFDKKSWNLLKISSKLRARRLCGLKYGSKIVNIETYNNQEIKQLNNRSWYYDKLIKLRYLSIFEDIEQHIEFYNAFKPDALYGLTSYFLQLGRYMHENGIKWNSQKLIFTSGEMLDIPTKNKLQKIFGPHIYDIYGTTELKEVSWECPKHEGHHINEDLYLVEFIDNDANIDEGEIVITSLVHHAMPLIRYSVGDRGQALNKYCSCGLPFALMSPSQGREVDYFILPNTQLISPYTLTMAMQPIEGILQFKIIQHTKTCVEVKIRPLDTCHKEMKQLIMSQLKKILGENITIRITPCQIIPHEKSGKYRVIQSLVQSREQNPR